MYIFSFTSNVSNLLLFQTLTNQIGKYKSFQVNILYKFFVLMEVITTNQFVLNDICS